MIVAIDGPAGAGKSTVARAVARKLGWTYVDTGAMYRAVTLAAIERGIDPADGAPLGGLARSLTIDLEGDRVLLDGRDVTERIREPRVTSLVSAVSSHGEVRTALVETQRKIASRGDVVMEGRDIGTAVAPDAPVKIWLTASLEERARRRAAELGGTQGGESSRVEAEIAERDEADSTRSTSPLAMPPDAHEIDSTGVTIEEVVRRIVDLVPTDE